MTIQWVLIASFLYFELALTGLLVLPFISSTIWKKIACFSLWKMIERKANMYFTVFIVVLILFFLDSIREMMKYSGIHPHDNAAAIQVHAKLFRSQRNYFIVGFAIFLCLVIRRLLMLLVTEADLFEKNKEAESALKASEQSKENAEKLIVNEKGDYCSQAHNEKLIKEIEKVQEDLLKKENEIESINQNREDLLERCRQYADDCNSLQEKINSLKGVDTCSHLSAERRVYISQMFYGRERRMALSLLPHHHDVRGGMSQQSTANLEDESLRAF